MKLSPHEQQALARYHLGGVEALRTKTYSVACSTLSALFYKGLMNRNGLTESGRQLAATLAQQGIV